MLPNRLPVLIHHPARRAVCRRAVLTLAMLALLLAQAVGLTHRVLHEPAQAGRFGVASQGAAQHIADDGARAHGAFSDHTEGGVECRLLDQLAHLDALIAVGALALAGPPPAVQLGVVTRSTAGRHSVVYQARAPPGRVSATPAAHTG
jgi:hypothetical protein